MKLVIKKQGLSIIICVALAFFIQNLAEGQAGAQNLIALSNQESNRVFLPVITSDTFNTYYLSPAGNDQNSGKSTNEAWATFVKAWEVMEAGDVLILMDGIYYQTLNPAISGEPGKPIVIRAQHDGKAIIDGQGIRTTVEFEKYRGSHFLLEGIVARDSEHHVYRVTSDYVTLRRVSGYNANSDKNTHIFSITGDYNLLEDCVASGTGRKMVLIYQGDNNIVRRCFTDWREWDGREWCNDWPWGEGLELYGANDNIIENSIAFGHTSRAGVSIMAQYPQTANGNKILGTITVYSGMETDGTPMEWVFPRPGPTSCTGEQNFEEWPSLLAGFRFGESSMMHDNLLQDIFAWGSARYGLTIHKVGSNADFNNNRINRATIIHNGLDNIAKWGGANVGASQLELDRVQIIENSYIENIWNGGSSYYTMEGEGARLIYRYVNGELTDIPLWPWPMEDRIQAELGYSVTDLILPIISSAP